MLLSTHDLFQRAGFWVWKNLSLLPPKRPADGSGVFQSLKDEPQVSRCVHSAHMPGTSFAVGRRDKRRFGVVWLHPGRLGFSQLHLVGFIDLKQVGFC